MANIVQIQTIVDGSTNTIIKVDIIGDGSGDEAKTVIFDASTYVNNTPQKKLWKMEYQLNGFSGFLEWDATVDKPLITMDEGLHEEVDWSLWFGGYLNNYFAGITGDILLTTSGLGAGDRGYMILQVKEA